MDIENNIELRTERDGTSIADEVLAELGFPSLETTSTVVQDVNTNTIISNSNTASTGISNDDINSMFNGIVDLPSDTPQEADAEEIDEDNELLDEEYTSTESTVAPTLEEVVSEIVNNPNKLPQNNKNLINNDSTARFSGAMWYDAIQKTTVVLAGLGGIGSNCLYILSRMHPKQIFAYDDDIVETVNLAGQMYNSDMVGRKKVDAMAELAIKFSNYHAVMAIPERYTKDTIGSDIMICGFDNMEARRGFFYSWCNHVKNSTHPEKCLYIDGRLNMSEFQVFCITGDDTYNIDKYSKNYLFSDNNVSEAICSMKQTTYCASMIASLMVNLFTNFIANQISPMTHDLPFMSYYTADIINIRTEV